MFQALFHLSDTALNTLMAFFQMFFRSLSNTFQNLPESFISKLPHTIISARKITGQGAKSIFRKYVCCPTCHSIFNWEECIIKLPNGQQDSKSCPFIQFPSHPQAHRRKPCGTALMKKVKSHENGLVLYPKRIYCYKSIIESLQDMLNQPQFISECEAWRTQSQSSELYSDIFDGRIWKDFQAPGGEPFLSLPYNFAFQINIDWFNPFKHTKHSEGAIYMTILNLPRQKRFLQENVMLVGVIPGPREPSRHLNSFLRPLVDELQILWRGVPLKNSDGHVVIVRGALLCSGCDIPAARKVCGFVGHGAKKGCSKCLSSFPTESFGEKADYSNFNRNLWISRTNEHHRSKAFEYRDCNTKADQAKIERDCGIRYTVLLELPYFDAARMCTVDPMHNLLLGTAKKMVQLWKELSIIDEKTFVSVQEKVDSFICPPDIGRVPYKISSGFAGFTAEQWKNWTVLFSLYALKDVLPWQHYNCWQLFVKSCFLLCRRSITQSQLNDADNYIMEFCRNFVGLYGPEHCTINMHLHGHLLECIRDYGPVYSFWCFAFERMNGILGSYHVNNHHISIQFMRKFLDSKIFAPCNWPCEYIDDYFPLLKPFSYQKGSLQQSTVESLILTNASLSFAPLPPIQEYALHSYEQDDLHCVFDSVLDENSYTILVLCQRAKALLVKDFVIGAKGSRHSLSSLVLAKHSTDDEVGLAQILFFAQCVAITKSDGHQTIIWVAAVSWFMDHPCRVWYGNPVQVWSAASFPGFSFIPVTNIISRVVYTKSICNFGRLISRDNVYVIVPLESK